MHDAWLSDTGIRVTDLDRSIAFYTNLLDLVELQRVVDDESGYVLFKDRRSGQRLELNWYSEKSPYFAPFQVGEGLDHLEVRVREVASTLARLRSVGVVPVPQRSLATNGAVVERLERTEADHAAWLDRDVLVTATGHHIAYIPDPDGNLICLYDHPEEPFDGPIPDHY